MPLSLDYAKRLLAKVDLENDPHMVLESPSYWDKTPCRLYFEACEDLIYRQPKAALKAMDASSLDTDALGGDPVVEVLTRAPHNDAPIGGLKVTTENGWFAARPSGTEEVYKIYAESFVGREHLATIQNDAKRLVGRVFDAADSG